MYVESMSAYIYWKRPRHLVANLVLLSVGIYRQIKVYLLSTDPSLHSRCVNMLVYHQLHPIRISNTECKNLFLFSSVG